MSIVLESTSQSFSSLGGLALFDEMIAATRLRELVKGALPVNVSKPLATSFQKFRALLLGFVAGADCLDDMDKLAADAGFEAVAKVVSDAGTYGHYLRAFDQPTMRLLNDRLSDMAFKMRRAVAKDADFILDLDSTHHEQAGVKMEGLGYAQGIHWGLSSLQAFDQFGFQYWMDVREGTAFTANGATMAITQIFRKVPRRQARFLRADSGYCNADVFNACHTADAKFVIPMRANMLDPLLKEIRHWHANHRMHTKDGRKVEVGTAIYRPERGRQKYRVMVMRAEKRERPLFEDKHDYYGFITNIFHGEMRDEELLDFYRARGNCENYIKELKNGFDIHHFPCKKLMANRAYGLIAAFAYNYMRLASFTLGDKRPRFSKMLRFRMIHVACQVVMTARRVIFRFNQHRKKEVEHWITLTHQQFGSG